MGLWKARRRRAAYSRLVTQVSEHDVIWAAEEIVGAAWMAGLDEAERQAVARHTPDFGHEGRESRVRRFVEHERVVWEQAERIRTLEILQDRDLLAEAGAGAEAESGAEARAAVRAQAERVVEQD